jgi:hypothetical protein
MQSRMTTDLALLALLSAVWRRKTEDQSHDPPDQGSQFVLQQRVAPFLGKHTRRQHEPPWTAMTTPSQRASSSY